MLNRLLLLVLLGLNLVSCIKDDILDDRVEPQLRITVSADSMEVGTDFQFVAMYLNNIGTVEDIDLTWSSSSPTVISIDAESGLASAHQEGSTNIIVQGTTAEGNITKSITVAAGENTVVADNQRSGAIFTTSSYTLTGTFTLSQIGTDLVLNVDDNYMASSNLPGLVLYLTNNPNTNIGAHEIGPVTVYNGSHSYNIPDVDINNYEYLLYYCAPINVKVGQGDIQ